MYPKWLKKNKMYPLQSFE